MSKQQLVEMMASKAGLTKADATRAIEALFDTVKTAMVKGERVAIPGFGTFSVGERAAREGRNPQTGEPMPIAASKAPRFKAGKALKDAINA